MPRLPALLLGIVVASSAALTARADSDGPCVTRSVICEARFLKAERECGGGGACIDRARDAMARCMGSDCTGTYF